MEWTQAKEIVLRIKSAEPGGDPDFEELFTDMVKNAVRYARIRTGWKLATQDERITMNAHRSSLHDVFIDSCNILERYMASRGLDTVWRDNLGGDRKEIGDFACYLHCMLGIAAR